MALMFLDSFDLCRELLPSHWLQSWPQNNSARATVFVEGPTWHYVGNGGIEIVRIDNGHMIFADGGRGSWVLHGRDPAWQLRKLQQAIRRLIKQNNNECPVCTGQAEEHVEECPFGWVLGGPDSWRRYRE